MAFRALVTLGGLRISPDTRVPSDWRGVLIPWTRVGPNYVVHDEQGRVVPCGRFVIVKLFLSSSRERSIATRARARALRRLWTDPTFVLVRDREPRQSTASRHVLMIGVLTLVLAFPIRVLAHARAFPVTHLAHAELLAVAIIFALGIFLCGVGIVAGLLLLRTALRIARPTRFAVTPRELTLTWPTGSPTIHPWSTLRLAETPFGTTATLPDGRIVTLPRTIALLVFRHPGEFAPSLADRHRTRWIIIIAASVLMFGLAAFAVIIIGPPQP